MAGRPETKLPFVGLGFIGIHWCCDSDENRAYYLVFDTPEGEEALFSVVVKIGLSGDYAAIGSLVNFNQSGSLTPEQERLLKSRQIPICLDTTKPYRQEWESVSDNEAALNKPLDEWKEARKRAMEEWERKHPQPIRKFIKGVGYSANTWRTMNANEAKLYKATYGIDLFPSSK